MKVAMMQPAFLPWQGYFELINSCDKFIFLDDFQFSLRSYQQRNRLFISKGQAGWYTVPICKGKSFLQPLNQTVINNTTFWRENFWKRIIHNYSKAEFFNELNSQVRDWLFSKADNLADLNIGFIRLACKLMGIRTVFLCSSQLSAQGKRSALVLELLRATQATQYFCAHGSFQYMLEDKIFPVKEIELFFQNYNILEYKQIGTKNFEPRLSILDALFNIGTENTLNLIEKNYNNWSSWEEMKGEK